MITEFPYREQLQTLVFDYPVSFCLLVLVFFFLLFTVLVWFEKSINEAVNAYPTRDYAIARKAYLTVYPDDVYKYPKMGKTNK